MCSKSVHIFRKSAQHCIISRTDTQSLQSPYTDRWKPIKIKRTCVQDTFRKPDDLAQSQKYQKVNLYILSIKWLLFYLNFYFLSNKNIRYLIHFSERLIFETAKKTRKNVRKGIKKAPEVKSQEKEGQKEGWKIQAIRIRSLAQGIKVENSWKKA